MKKTLLSAAIAALAMGSANAQIYDNYNEVLIYSMSDNGQFIYNQNINSGVTVLDRFTGAQFDDYDENGINTYTINGISNKGVCVGSDGNNPYYWYNGKGYSLPQPEGCGEGMGSAYCITKDSKFISGSVSTGVSFGADGLMCVPAIWTLQDDGNYTVEVLPYDELDFSGRAPQYIMASCISQDGKTVIVQVRDYSGYVCYPVLYKKGDNNEWSRKIITPDFFWNAERIKNLPKEPVDPSSEIPVPEAYYTKQDTIDCNNAITEYNEAYDQYKQGLIDYEDLPVYPDKWRFITEKREQWVADSTEYQAKYTQYFKDADEFYGKFAKALTQRSIQFNSFRLSGNDRYVATTVNNNASYSSYPAYIDLAKEELVIDTIAALTDASCTSITDDGHMIMVTPLMDLARNTMVCKIGESEKAPVNFVDYIASLDANAAAFMKENYTFKVPTYDGGDEPGWGDGGDEPGWGGDDGGMLSNRKLKALNSEEGTGSEEVTDSVIVGTVLANSDGTIFTGFFRECFSNDEYIDVDHSYVLDLNKDAISAGIDAVKGDNEGNAKVTGREFYSINGQRLGRLPLKGVYLEKVMTTKGVKTFKRVK